MSSAERNQGNRAVTVWSPMDTQHWSGTGIDIEDPKRVVDSMRFLAEAEELARSNEELQQSAYMASRDPQESLRY
jgi:hypothetical protein